MHSLSYRHQSKIVTVTLVLMVVTIWLLLRGYHGLLGDGQLYAFQALARIHPYLATDLYLQNTSQDQFTIFSPVYARFIEFLGLENAARLLTLVFTAWFLAAAWAVARALTNRDGAWLAVAFLLIVSGNYGGSGVFSFAEEFLTARLPAEALIATSLACYVGGSKRLALVIGTMALLVHPLIALPGLLLLICLSVPIGTSVVGAIGCIAIAALISCGATFLSTITDLFPLMDREWLNVVQERSQFLFLQLWSFRDWEINTRPFFYLAFISLVLHDVRVRRVCSAAALVGLTGLAVAFIAGLLGPVALLVQGQAWRWVWIAVFASTLLTPAAILRIWQDKYYGPLCAVLLASGLTLPAIDGTACVSLAIVLWSMKSRISDRTVRHFRWIVVALIVAIGAWVLDQSWSSVISTVHSSAGFGAAQVRDIFGVRILVAVVATLTWWFVRSSRAMWLPTLLSSSLLIFAISVLPTAFKQSRTLASSKDIAEFADWERAIPQTSSVLVLPPRDVGAFVWFTLQRPNYLAIDQSSGVVFSRATAVEVQRRSRVLLPVMDPNWKILTGLRTSATKPAVDASGRQLNADTLRQICADSPLGFVISPHDIGFDSLTHKHAGAWAGWNLYDCFKVRSLPTAKQ
jgi:hypothetical protein